MTLRYWAIIVLLGGSWGASFFFNEILLREIGPLSIGLGRVGMGALGCWLYLLAARKSLSLPRAMLVPLAVFGLFQYAVPLTVYPLTQQYITSGAAGIINAMTPIMVVCVGHFWPGGERATLGKSIGVAVGFAGIVIVVAPAFHIDDASHPWALLATMIAPLCYGIALNLLRGLDGVDRVLLTAWSLTIGTVMIAPISIGAEGIPVITKAETWAALIIIGFVLTSAAFIVLFWLIPRVGGTRASTITFIAPISALLLGGLVLGEKIGPQHLLGMAVIFIGLAFLDGRIRWPRRNCKPIG